MILKGSQRGGSAQLATHLLKTEENEHVEIHELNGFVADDLHGALSEINAVSRGTKCGQFMFSVSLNPPETEKAPIEYFEKAITDIEEKMGLKGQPRAVVFHEKEGRRHCHAVWSRINTDEMKAINLPYYKLKLRDVSKQLYFHYGWQMPRGLIDKEERNPLNFTLAEWQQAKRLQENSKALKQLFQNCWTVSDNKETFERALNDNGLYLAKGDRRGFVAIDYRGEVFSLNRWVNVKTRELKSRLGEPELFASADEVKRHIAARMTKKLKTYIYQAQGNITTELKPFIQRKRSLVKYHQKERQMLTKMQEDRWQKETMERSELLPRGLKAVWHRITGKYQKVYRENQQETEQRKVRDRDEKQNLINHQLKERQKLQGQIKPILQEHQKQILRIKQDIGKYLEMGEPSQKALQEDFGYVRQSKDIEYTPEL
jgi:MobA/VirD2-like, nuclease domain